MNGESPQPNTPARAGRGISTGGLIGLGLSFFLPQITSCGSPYVPAREIARNPGSALLFIPFLLALALLAIYLVRAFALNGRASRGLSHAACAVTLAAFLVADTGLGWGLADNGVDPQSAEGVLLLTLCAALLIGTAATLAGWLRALPDRRVALCAAATGLASLVYFCLFLPDALWGLYVSIASSALALAGGAFEAFARLRRGDPS